MASISVIPKTLMGHASFSRSIESHGSAHSADTNCAGWRGQGTITSEDIGTQTEAHALTASGGSSMTGSGKLLSGEVKRRRDETIVDISLESMKYNGGKGSALLEFVDRLSLRCALSSTSTTGSFTTARFSTERVRRFITR